MLSHAQEELGKPLLGVGDDELLKDPPFGVRDPHMVRLRADIHAYTKMGSHRCTSLQNELIQAVSSTPTEPQPLRAGIIPVDAPG